MKFQTHNDELFLAGTLSIIQVSSLFEIIQKHLAQCREQIIINLREVETLDINVLQLLIATKKSAKKEKKRMLLSEIPQHLYDVCRLSGIDSIFNLNLD